MEIRSGPGTSSGIADLNTAPNPAAPNPAAAGQVSDQARRMARAGGGYSHFVKFLKVVLPLLAFGIIGLLAAWPRIQGGDQVGQPPRYRRAGDDAGALCRHRYAEPALLADGGPGGPIDQRAWRPRPRPSAGQADASGRHMAVPSRPTGAGTTTRRASCWLFGNANLFHDKGYEFKSDEAHVDVRAGNAWGDLPVTGPRAVRRNLLPWVPAVRQRRHHRLQRTRPPRSGGGADGVRRTGPGGYRGRAIGADHQRQAACEP